MGAVERSSGVVESQLSELEDSYDSFSINQRTISVPTAQYEQKRERSDQSELEAHAKVRNDRAEVLHVDVGGHRVLPSISVPADGPLEERLRSRVAEAAGVDCRVEGIAGVTILGLRDADDPDRDTVYRLAALFEATFAGGLLDPDATWKEYEPDAHPVYV